MWRRRREISRLYIIGRFTKLGLTQLAQCKGASQFCKNARTLERWGYTDKAPHEQGEVNIKM